MTYVDLCCACGILMKDVKEHNYVNFRFEVPGEEARERVLVAVVCKDCGKDAEDPLKFAVIEGMINAKVIRDQYPEKMFTPEGYE